MFARVVTRFIVTWMDVSVREFLEATFGCSKTSLLEFLKVLSVGIIRKNVRVPESQWFNEILEQEIGVQICLRIF